MKHRASTRLIEFHPYPQRNERCALGLLAFRHDGSVRAHLAHNLRKVRAMDPSCDIEALRNGLDRVAAELAEDRSSLSAYVDGFGSLRIAPTEGYVTYTSEDEYESAIQWALDVGAEPVAAHSIRERAPISRLFLEVKGVFHSFGWLAKMGQGIEDHVIVPRFSLSPDEGLSVDFALKNTAMHYLQTVDFRSAHHVSQRRTEAQAKALALGLAEQLIQHPLPAQRYFVVAGAGEPDAKRTIKMAERVCEHVFAHESTQDMDELLSILSRAMGQPPLEPVGTR
jgi:hypothetical protein